MLRYHDCYLVKSMSAIGRLVSAIVGGVIFFVGFLSLSSLGGVADILALDDLSLFGYVTHYYARIYVYMRQGCYLMGSRERKGNELHVGGLHSVHS
ncbi:hypothetical protein F4804DRAFT_72968 [Jackrogersella minutella]|nr:hypothetical protein F4804DRAFT_72968 [Jackrogersella minutella]